jgi:hypothetical protein
LKGTVLPLTKLQITCIANKKSSNRNLLLGHKGVKIPESAKAFLQRLNKLAPLLPSKTTEKILPNCSFKYKFTLMPVWISTSWSITQNQ